MKNPICISTGCFYKITNDHNSRIEAIRKFNPDGIMLTIADADSLLNFDLSEKNLHYIQTLKCNSIHAPWINIIYSSNEHFRNALKKIKRLYEYIHADDVVFHQPTDNAEDFDYEILKEYSFSVSIENDDWKYPTRLDSVEKIRNILEKHSDFRFSLDLAHVLTIDPTDIEKYFQKFKNKIARIHVAMLTREIKDHWFLHKYDSAKLQNLLKTVDNKTIPLVLECVARDENEMELFKNEIEYLRNL